MRSMSRICNAFLYGSNPVTSTPTHSFLTGLAFIVLTILFISYRQNFSLHYYCISFATALVEVPREDAENGTFVIPPGESSRNASSKDAGCHLPIPCPTG